MMIIIIILIMHRLRPNSWSWHPLRSFAITLRHSTNGTAPWTSDQPNAENSDNTQHSQETEYHASDGI